MVGPGCRTVNPTTTSPEVTGPASPSQALQPIEITSVTGPLRPINPGGPIVKITLQNVAAEPVIYLKATLDLSRPYDFAFDVSTSNPLPANGSVSSALTLIGGGFSDAALYSLTINGTFEDGSKFAFTRQVRIAAPAQ
jgi:hypothetical protein